MYSTCLYCTRDLGANEVIETLPIGRRLAFDERQGRLWVICRSCEKWNLVPFDTRLESIDACERLFRGTHVRYSTDNIGIARLPEGLELVRVGPALRPEFAAWRYGDQFGRRRIKTAVQTGAGIAGVVAFLSVGHAVILAAGLLPQIGIHASNAFRRHRVVVRNPGPPGTGGVMTSFDVQKSKIMLDSSETWHGSNTWRANLVMRKMVPGPFVKTWNRPREIEVTGSAAVSAIGRILPQFNYWSGSRRVVQDAVELVEEKRGIDGVILHAMAQQGIHELWLKHMPGTHRVALEMSAHEDTERAALAGELKLLERQWKEAEELAKIVDDLAIGEEVSADLDARKLKPESGGRGTD